ncbi:MAG: class I SAM-dependent methyltransferase [Variibacter sp.]|nr:class I SAM-dependent methyltransferase [Variibacter sp.]
MSVFSAEWLDLREPYDAAARNRTVLEAVAAAFKDRFAITVADLGCGTGSTLRAIASHLPGRQTWRLYDNNLGLLTRPTEQPPGAHVHRIALDLARDLELALDGPVDLVTASALLDLVSDVWVDRLAVEAATRRLPVYAALIYDGRVTFSPPDPLDARVIAAVNRHQLTDKGFGPALGPSAAPFAMKRFQRVGYTVSAGRSDWEFAPTDREIQMQLLAGWAQAAQAVGVVPLSRVQDWLARRRDLVGAGRSTLRVGHMDFFAWPMTTL